MLTGFRLIRHASRITKMGPIETSIREKLNAELKPVFLDVVNESYKHNVPKGVEMHFKVIAVAPEFQGMTLIQRHRRINAILDEELKNGLHALSIVAKTPEQWEQSNQVDETPKCLGGSKK